MNRKDSSGNNNADRVQLMESLGVADGAAIQMIGKKIKPDIKQLVLKHKLSPLYIEEVLHDAIILLITAIRNGKYQDQGYHPAAYALGVARNLILNKARGNKLKTEELDHVSAISDFNPEEYLESKERLSIIESLLDKLDKACKQLIQYKYFENFRDKEVLDRKLSPYNSVATIKSKRSQCMKKLTQLAMRSGIKPSI